MSSSLSRRTFLALAGAVPFALRGSGASTTPPVGLELYTVRDALEKDLMGTIRAVAKMGYTLVEFYSPYYKWTPQQAADVRKLLDDLGMHCLSTHNSSDALAASGIQKAIDLNQAIGSKYIVMASPGDLAGADGWKAVADRLNAAAERLKPLGMVAGTTTTVRSGRRSAASARWTSLPRPRRRTWRCSSTLARASRPALTRLRGSPRTRGGSRACTARTGRPGRSTRVLFGEGVSPWAKIFAAAESTGGIEYYLIEQEQGPAGEQLQRAEACLANWKKMRG